MRSNELHVGATAHTLVDGIRHAVTVEGTSTDRKHWVVVTSGGLRLDRKARDLQSPKRVASEIARAERLRGDADDQDERQIDAGIVEYIWSTSCDERVREGHRALEGTTQRWDSPPIVDAKTGRRAHPGFDDLCRCCAIPVLPTDE